MRCPPAWLWLMAVLLWVCPTAQAQLLDSGARGLPALADVELGYAPERTWVLSARGGYGFIEELDGASGAHHRGLTHLGVSTSPTPWLSATVAGDGVVRPDPAGEAALLGVTPSLTVRLHPKLHDDLLVGLSTGLSMPPGLDAITTHPDALRGRIKALLGGRASRNVLIAGELGFRFDNSAALIDNRSSLDGDSRLASGADDFHGLLFGLGFGYGFGSSALLVDLTGDFPMSTGSDQIGQAPLRVGGEFRTALGGSIGLHLRASGDLNGRPPLSPDAQLIAVQPRVQAEVGLTIAFGGELARPAVGGFTAKGEAVVETPEPPTGAAAAGPEGPAAPTAAQSPTQAEPEPGPEAEPPPPAVDTSKGHIRGHVRSARGKVLKATAVVYPLGTKVESDEDGEFALEIDPGKYTVRVRSYGYRSQNREIVVTAGSVTLLNVELRKK